ATTAPFKLRRHPEPSASCLSVNRLQRHLEKLCERRQMLRTLLLGTALATLLITAAVSSEAPRSYKVGHLIIESPWIRATPAGARVAGGYVKIINSGQTSDRLIGGSLPVAAEVQVHEMSMNNGIMSMRMLKYGLEIDPGKSVELKPGGYHLMFT